MRQSRVAATLAAAVLGVGVLVSVASATRPCTPKACAADITAACDGVPGSALAMCRMKVLRNCRTTACSCTGSPACGSPSGAFLD